MSTPERVTAAVLVIGDEILSGRTKDKNLGYIAEYLTRIGIDLCEARVVPDIEDEIVAALDALRARYTYVFTTGGIGPTHDDITADAVARAFGTGISINEEAVSMLLERIPRDELNEARLRMARIPHGASLIPNPVSKAPGFRIGNVFVMAGVPAIMQAMLDQVAPTLDTGVPIISEMIEVREKEGDVAAPLRRIQEAFLSVQIGSYPFFEDGVYGTRIVVRGRDAMEVRRAADAVNAMASSLAAAREAPHKAG
ncbi:competence/damage-inducible protein A [Rhodoligotrophos defluvii]|uniref:competence/damage-inducible protein A n=1 Tax=Rhodoligotrophos defluvii TaxID=2561934 RepID=UPI0010C9B0C2|nr:molybdopterin-binding protein [Rhodoligotrophos defluvii]